MALDERLFEGAALARSFVKEDGGSGCGVERFDGGGHWDANAGVSAAFDFFAKARTLVADQQGYGFAPVDLPRRKERLLVGGGLARTGFDGLNADCTALRLQHPPRHNHDD